MAIDFKNIDKRKVAVVGGAVLAGLIAVILTNSYINQTVEERSGAAGAVLGSREMKKLMARIDALEQENKQLAGQQRQLFAAQAKQKQPPKPKEVGVQQALLSTKTPPGKRAITVTIQKLSAVGGMIAPGDYVDIIAHLKIPKSPKKIEPATLILFQNVQILAVSDNTQFGEKTSVANISSIPVTFALNPREAQLMSFARQHGNLQLVLRSPFDSNEYAVPEANWQTLADYISTTQGVDIPVPPSESEETAAPKEKKPSIEIYRGGRSQ